MGRTYWECPYCSQTHDEDFTKRCGCEGEKKAREEFKAQAAKITELEAENDRLRKCLENLRQYLIDHEAAICGPFERPSQEIPMVQTIDRALNKE